MHDFVLHCLVDLLFIFEFATTLDLLFYVCFLLFFTLLYVFFRSDFLVSSIIFWVCDHPSKCFVLTIFHFLAKGRTNVELREQFTLAPGVSQSMTAFKAKPGARTEGSPNSSVSGGQTGRNPSISGPITKVCKQKISIFRNIRFLIFRIIEITDFWNFEFHTFFWNLCHPKVRSL